MSRWPLVVRDLDGTEIGMSRWNSTSDTMDTYRIYPPGESIYPREYTEKGEPSEADRLATIEMEGIGAPSRVWINKEGTLITDAGSWMEPVVWGAGDYGYCDVIDGHEHYEPHPIHARLRKEVARE